MKYYVDIIKRKNDKTIKQLGPMNKSKAERCERGVEINLDHEKYYTEIVEAE